MLPGRKRRLENVKSFGPLVGREVAFAIAVDAGHEQEELQLVSWRGGGGRRGLAGVREFP
jgi:hypothetical protein